MFFEVVSGAPNPCFKTWFITGKSWVCHGLVTGSAKTRFLVKTRFLCHKPWLLCRITRFSNQKTRVCHGFPSTTCFFLKKNYKNTICLYVELSEPMILVIEPWLHIRNPLHQRVLGMIPRKCSGIFNLVEPLR